MNFVSYFQEIIMYLIKIRQQLLDSTYPVMKIARPLTVLCAFFCVIIPVQKGHIRKLQCVYCTYVTLLCVRSQPTFWRVEKGQYRCRTKMPPSESDKYGFLPPRLETDFMLMILMTFRTVWTFLTTFVFIVSTFSRFSHVFTASYRSYLVFF